MDRSCVVNSLGKQLGVSHASRLVDRYRAVQQKYITRQWEECLASTGKFIEAVLRCLIYYVDGETHEIVDVGKQIDRLSNIPKDKHNAEIRIHIPRVCRALYDLRSNWGGGHDKLAVNPVSMDAQFAYTGVKWLMLECMRRFSNIGSDEMQALIDAFHPPSFLTQQIEDDLVFLDNSIKIREAVILVVTHWFPQRVKSEKIVCSITWRNDKSVKNELSTMTREGYLHKSRDGYLATQKTLIEASRIHERYQPVDF